MYRKISRFILVISLLILAGVVFLRIYEGGSLGVRSVEKVVE